MHVTFERETIIPDKTYDGRGHPARWIPPGSYPVEPHWFEGELVYVIVDTSLGYSLDMWRSVNGYGGITLHFETN